MALSARDADNLLRWDGARRGFYEVYYLKLNDPGSRTAAWIRYTLTSPLPAAGEPYCELWGVFFDAADPSRTLALKTRYGIDRLGWERDRFEVRVGEARLGPDFVRGSLSGTGGDGELSWDLRFSSDSPPLHHFPQEWMYRAGFPKTKVLSPHPDARFTGLLRAGDREIRLQDAPGQQTHLWGTQHAARWAWGHCNAFREDPRAVWEGLDSQIALGPWRSPHLKLFYLKAFGEEHWFNAPARWLRNGSRWELGRWDFVLEDDRVKVLGVVRSDLAEFVGVTYMDPDGQLLWCNNSKVANLDLYLFDRAGNPRGRLSARQTCAAEYVDRRIYPEVRIRI